MFVYLHIYSLLSRLFTCSISELRGWASVGVKCVFPKNQQKSVEQAKVGSKYNIGVKNMCNYENVTKITKKL